MYRERAPDSVLSLREILLWSLFLLPAIAAAPQQQPQPVQADSGKHAVSPMRSAKDQHYDSLSTAYDGQRGFRDTYPSNARSSTNERALATFAPARSDDQAVRATPASHRSSASTAGLTSRQPARSLQDWQVEDIILLATVDGKIHARDRKTGVAKWQLEVDRPMVETVYHRQNKSEERLGEDPLWIVEPSQDGSIYVYAPGSGLGMQKLAYTVKQLVELSPYAGDGEPAVAYTAEKKNTLYTIDAGTGNILKTFSSGGSIVNDDTSCRRVNPLEGRIDDDDECEQNGTLTLGRTEYTIGIQDRNTGEAISTIKYFEWGPNNRDQDLRSKYTNTMDSKYVYSRYDGSVFGLDLAQPSDYTPAPTHKPTFRHKFTSPVARIYDVVRPWNDISNDAHLVVLPQPLGPSPSENDNDDDIFDSVYVNCTDTGSWFALSEINYPTVTHGASKARCYNEELYGMPAAHWPMNKVQRDKFAGVHQLAPAPQHGPVLIEAPYEYPGIGAPDEPNTTEVLPINMPNWHPPWERYLPSMRKFIGIVIGLLAITLYQQRNWPIIAQIIAQKQGLEYNASTAATAVLEAVPEIEKPADEGANVLMVRQPEPAEETVFPHDGDFVEKNDMSKDDTESPPADAFNEIDELAKGLEDGAPQKKKATRGRRGGRKQKEKEQTNAELRAPKQSPRKAEVISVDASESPLIAGPILINSLLIHTDRIIGQGSAGTCVFEGSFEGRDVAVKRMLSQYYGLASQEVSFLQQSDDHPNVIRYFCQQKDSHFLYIAVELCQASLWDIWHLNCKDEARREQLNQLVITIQQDVSRALQQLAAGLSHLHNLRIIHRDIKPQNILVAYPKKNQGGGPRLVISDFGLGKTLPENVSTLIDPTGNAGTSGWKAPELISQPKDSDRNSHSHTSQPNGSESNGGATSGVKRAADIFSLGCLFFWVLTNGCHPFDDKEGWTQMRELNIKKNHKNMGVLTQWQEAYEPTQLISWMLEHQPEDRPTALQVLNHPFFWPADKRITFLCDVSDHFERESRGDAELGQSPSLDLQALENRAEEVIGQELNFLAKLDKSFLDTLGKQRKYTGGRMLDLLRALRNKKNHYEDMPEEVKKRVGSLPGGYLMYWTGRFPRLLMACYEVVHDCRVQGNDRFRGYFAISS